MSIADLSNLTEKRKLTQDTVGGLQVYTADQRVEYLNMLIYGESGVGKTELGGSSYAVPEMRPVLIVDVEGGVLTLTQRYPGVEVVRMDDWKELQAIYDELRRGKSQYRTVVLDSLTEMQRFSMERIMDDVIRKEPERDPDVPAVRDWGKNSEQIRRTVRAFRDLPMHTIFTALSKEDRTPTGVITRRPSLPGKLASEVAAFVDVVGYLYIKKNKDELKRFLLTMQTEKEVAKDRSGKLPSLVENPTMQGIMQFIRNENKERN